MLLKPLVGELMVDYKKRCGVQKEYPDLDIWESLQEAGFSVNDFGIIYQEKDIMQENNSGAMIKLGGLWLNEGKHGKYMAGYLNGHRLLIFKNSYKQNEKDPDYEFFLAEKKKKKEPIKEEGEDDIPF